MVGLFAYNPPQCLAAIKGAGKAGKIKVVGFDEQDDTLAGIQEGSVYGTVSQQPFRYVLAELRHRPMTTLIRKVKPPRSCSW